MSVPYILSAVVLATALLGLLSRKWCLPGRPTVPIILLSAVGALLAGFGLARAGIQPWVVFVLTGFIEGTVFVGSVLWLFYRDPERNVPSEPGVIVSPADGIVIYIRRLEAGEPLRSDKNGALVTLDELRNTSVAKEALWQIGISMVFTDVHINRAPIAGTVSLVQHKPGKFLSLRLAEALNVNERQTMLIEGDNMQVVLVQIASRLVRQIAAYVKVGEKIPRGHRVGIIKFGSQVDLFLPVAKVPQLLVTLSQRLTAGETIVARHS